MLRTETLRGLTERDLSAALDLLDRDPVQNVFVAARLGTLGLDSWRLGADVWGFWVDGRLDALCYAGANLVPVSAGGPDADAVRAFAERARVRGRRCSSIVGAADLVAPLWELLAPSWGPARDVRPRQPVMATRSAPTVPADPLVRRVRLDEVDVLLPASIAMFTEEVGVSPLTDGQGVYRARVTEIVQAGRAFARIEDDRVVFKAEVGAVSASAAQIQGVWVIPELRGRGLATGGMAAVVEHTLASIAPVATLYVNDYNAPARAVYRRVGFRETGTCMTVLF